MLLAIDTATRNASIALYDAAGVQAEVTWHSRQNHTVELTAQIVQAMEIARIDKKALKAVGVALGPGSFTGLRVGMSVAKGLAFACAIPILGVPTLDALARAHALQPLPIYAILSAGRGRYSVARYVPRSGAAERSGDHALVNADGLIELAARETSGSGSAALFCGEIDAPLADMLARRLGAQGVISPPANSLRRAGFLAELAWERLQRGESDDAASLAPIYATDSSQ